MRQTLDQWLCEKIGVHGPLTRAALERWQLQRLNETIAHARANSPFYRRMENLPDAPLTSLKHLARLPFTTAEDLRRSDPPFLALSQGEIARTVTLPTSGTSGEPKRLHFTEEDQDATIDYFAAGMSLFTRAGDRVAIAFPGERPGGIGQGLSAALKRMGAEPVLVPLGFGTEVFLRRLREVKPHVIAGPPVPIMAAAKLSSLDGGDPPAIRAALLSSDHVARSLASALRRCWGTDVYTHWGMTETGYGGAVDCVLHNGCHIRENELLLEVVDPVSGAPLADGEIGEVVLTTLNRRALPLIRYRTGDLACLTHEPCGCGSVLARLGDFGGRLDGAVCLPGGGRLGLPLLDELIFAEPDVSDYELIREKAPVPGLSLRIAAVRDDPGLCDRLYQRLIHLPAIRRALDTVGFTLGVTRVEAIVLNAASKRKISIR